MPIHIEPCLKPTIAKVCGFGMCLWEVFAELEAAATPQNKKEHITTGNIDSIHHHGIRFLRTTVLGCAGTVTDMASGPSETRLVGRYRYHTLARLGRAG